MGLFGLLVFAASLICLFIYYNYRIKIIRDAVEDASVDDETDFRDDVMYTYLNKNKNLGVMRFSGSYLRLKPLFELLPDWNNPCRLR